MRSRMIAASGGMALVALLPVLPPLPPAVLLGIMIVLLPGLWWAQRAAGLVLAFLVGLLWSLCFAQWRLDSLLPPSLEGRDFWVAGLVTGLPQAGSRAQQIHFHVERSCFDLLPADCPADNQVFRNRLILLNYYGTERLAPGQRWFWRVRLAAPRGFANPGGFDYEAWLVQQGVSARGYVRDTAFNARLEDGAAWMSRIRHVLRERLLLALQDRPGAGLVVALVLGDRELVSAEDWALFTQTGTNHLIVISGLHVGFVAWLCHSMAGAAARFLPSVLLRLPAQHWGALAAVLGSVCYSMLAGFSVPTQRACIMVLVFAGAQLLARRFPHSFSYCLAMLLVLAGNPMSVVGAGFWLSFGAVGTLLLAFSGTRHLHHRAARPTAALSGLRALDLHRRWAQWVRPQWVVFIGMTVPLAAWMQQLSLLAPLANVLAIPLVSLLVVPLCLVGAGLLFVHAAAGRALLQLADTLLGGLSSGLDALVGAPVPVLWEFRGINRPDIVLALMGSVLLLMPRGWPGRWLGAVLLLPLAVPGDNAVPPGEARIAVLDVGQGLAVVVRTASHTLVFDTGPRFSDNFDAGAGIVVPYLRSAGVRQLDRIFVSHGDNDHAGGLASVLASVSADQLFFGEVPEASYESARFGNPVVSLCARGQRWEWDDVRFAVLWPPAGQHSAGNDSSCVLRVEAAGTSMLLTGDIEAAAEAALLRAEGGRLRSDWLLAPHHGSQTSSTPAFVDAVAPRDVVFAAGYRSQFRHPAATVVARYQARNIVAWSTAMRGALEVCLGDENVCGTAPRAWRETRRRWWQREESAASRHLHGEWPAPLQAL